MLNNSIPDNFSFKFVTKNNKSLFQKKSKNDLKIMWEIDYPFQYINQSTVVLPTRNSKTRLRIMLSIFFGDVFASPDWPSVCSCKAICLHTTLIAIMRMTTIGVDQNKVKLVRLGRSLPTVSETPAQIFWKIIIDLDI